jgi:ATP-dependent Lon protease
MMMEQHSTDDSGPALRETKPSAQIPPGALAILPLRNSVLFPYTVMPLTIGRPASLQAIEDAVRHQLPIGIVVQKDPGIDAPQINDLYEIGTAAEVLRMSPSRDGQRQLIVRGRQRFRVVEFLQTDPFLVALTLMLEESAPPTKEFEARIMHLREQAAKTLSLLPQPTAELRSTIENIEDPVALIDIIASTLDLPTTDKQEILATLDVETRLQMVSRHLTRQVELLELTKKNQSGNKRING